MNVTAIKNILCNKIHPMVTDVSMLFVRFALAIAFFKSGMNKWLGFFKFNPNSYDVFLYELFCPEPAREGALRLCGASGEYESGVTVFLIERFTNMAGLMEIILPIMLFIGLGSRFAALGLFAMSMFIQLFVFTDATIFWTVHIWWIATALAIISHGSGRLSVDHLLKRFKTSKK